MQECSAKLLSKHFSWEICLHECSKSDRITSLNCTNTPRSSESDESVTTFSGVSISIRRPEERSDITTAVTAVSPRSRTVTEIKKWFDMKSDILLKCFCVDRGCSHGHAPYIITLRFSGLSHNF